MKTEGGIDPLRIEAGDFCLEFPVKDRLNFIIGDSGAGKSKMIAELENALIMQRGGDIKISSSYDIDLIDIVTKADLSRKDFSRWNDNKWHILFIDRFDTFESKELLDFVNTPGNIFFLIGRCAGQNDISERNLNVFGYDGKVYRIYNLKYDRTEFYKRLYGE